MKKSLDKTTPKTIVSPKKEDTSSEDESMDVSLSLY